MRRKLVIVGVTAVFLMLAGVCFFFFLSKRPKHMDMLVNYGRLDEPSDKSHFTFYPGTWDFGESKKCYKARWTERAKNSEMLLCGKDTIILIGATPPGFSVYEWWPIFGKDYFSKGGKDEERGVTAMYLLKQYGERFAVTVQSPQFESWSCRRDTSGLICEGQSVDWVKRANTD